MTSAIFCPLQLEVIRRGIDLWTNPNDVVLSPFAGIGSELHVAVEMGRRAVGVELKASYYQQAGAKSACGWRSGFVVRVTHSRCCGGHSASTIDPPQRGRVDSPTGVNNDPFRVPPTDKELTPPGVAPAIHHLCSVWNAEGQHEPQASQTYRQSARIA